MKFKEFLANLTKDAVSGYVYISTLIVIVSFTLVQALLGPAPGWPVPGQVPDLHGVVFLLLISSSIFLLVVTCVEWTSKGHSWLQGGKGLAKMLALNVISLALALVLPIALFIAIYLVAYLAWHVINATFTVMLGRDVSTKVAGRVTVKHGKLGLALYILFWLVMIGISGAAWMFLDWASFPLPVQMPLLAIPLFAMVIPVAGLVIKPRSGYRSPVTMFVLVLFMMVMYTWVRYITWDPAAGPRIFSIPDAIIDVVLVTYTFFVITKNSDKISSALRGKVSPRQLFMLVAWCRVSSMILLMAVGDYQLAGLDAREGTYLLGMLFIFILGTIHALAWARQGVVATRGTMTMPDLAGQFHR